MNFPHSELKFECMSIYITDFTVPTSLAFRHKMCVFDKLIVYQHLNTVLTMPRGICYFEDFW